VVDGEWSPNTKFDLAPAGFFDFRQRSAGNGFRVSEEPIADRLLRFQLLFPSAEMMHRSFYDAVGGWNGALGRTLAYDFEFAVRCTASTPIGIIDAPLVGIRKHASNKSGDDMRTTIGEIEILQFIEAHHKLARESREIVRDEIVLRSMDVAESAFRRGDEEAFWRAIGRAPMSRRGYKLHLKTMINLLPAGIRKTLRRRVLA
jgi:hypothetical protein